MQQQVPSQVEERLGQGVENVGCPSHARRRRAACFAELRRPEAARLDAQRPACPMVLCAALAWSLAPAGGLWHETLDPHRRVVSVGRHGSPGSQRYGHREGKQTLATREPPSCCVRAKDQRAVGEKKVSNNKFAQNRYNSSKEHQRLKSCRRRQLLGYASARPVSNPKFVYGQGLVVTRLCWLRRDSR